MRSIPGLACAIMLGLFAGCATGEGVKPGRRVAGETLDIVPRRIPPVLADAMENPYASPSPLDCATIAGQLRQLDEALGRDWDDPARPQRGDAIVAHWLAGEVKAAIPYFTWLRWLTGADRRQRLADAAGAAGHVRRGYLRGLDQALGCPRLSAPASTTGE